MRWRLGWNMSVTVAAAATCLLEAARPVQVDWAQLQRWYRTLDHLLLNQETLEVALYERLRTLFDFQPDLVMYDLTSTYFEGHGPALAQYGYSRDGKPRNAQDRGGRGDGSRMADRPSCWATATRRDGDDQGGGRRCGQAVFLFAILIFVGDRGMVTKSNLKLLSEGDGHGFLVGMTRRRKSGSRDAH